MDNLSVAIGILAPVVVVLIIVAGLRAIIRADRREKEFMAAPDQRDDREDAPERRCRTSQTRRRTTPAFDRACRK
jgi:hypothetical protein